MGRAGNETAISKSNAVRCLFYFLSRRKYMFLAVHVNSLSHNIECRIIDGLVDEGLALAC